MMRKKLTLALFMTLFTTSAFCANDGLLYKFKNESFLLKKECVSSISIIPSEYVGVEVLNTQLVDNSECARKLNSLIDKNIGGEMSTFFNGNLWHTSNIVDSVKTENSFRMTSDEAGLVQKAYDYYH